MQKALTDQTPICFPQINFRFRRSLFDKVVQSSNDGCQYVLHTSTILAGGDFVD